MQQPNGSFVMTFMHIHITNKFTKLTNVAVKIQAPNTPPNASTILINSHFDSALGGLGATDAGALCSVMIEMIRNILNSDASQFTLNYPVISNFSLC